MVVNVLQRRTPKKTRSLAHGTPEFLSSLIVKVDFLGPACAHVCMSTSTRYRQKCREVVKMYTERDSAFDKVTNSTRSSNQGMTSVRKLNGVDCTDKRSTHVSPCLNGRTARWASTSTPVHCTCTWSEQWTTGSTPTPPLLYWSTCNTLDCGPQKETLHSVLVRQYQYQQSF